MATRWSPAQRRAYFARMQGQLGSPGRYSRVHRYSPAERAVRRGGPAGRLQDLTAQTVLPASGVLVGASAGHLFGRTRFGAALGGLVGFGAAARHVKRLRDERLLAAGGTVRSFTGRPKVQRWPPSYLSA